MADTPPLGWTAPVKLQKLNEPRGDFTMISTMKTLALVIIVLTLPGPYSALAREPEGPALWQVANEDTTIYLFGTIHILPKGVDWLSGPVKTAFDASPEFVTEADMTKLQSFASKMVAAGTLPEGQTLRSLMRNDHRAEYEEVVSELGLPIENLDRLEPWLVAQSLRSVILTRNGYNPNLGVDAVLTGLASKKRKDTLETLEWQLDMFDTTPMAQQLGNLDNIVGWAPTVRQWNDRMVDLWLAGRTAGLAEHVGTAFPDPAYRDRLLTDRNGNWAEWIDDRLDRPGTVFVAVGIGHLVGMRSVQKQLAERGIETDRIQ